ncbi:MAG: DUF3798 domain-containing protein [Lachnospiraceae bacterium]|nr:DUF3798 domain-containing protein [Lachnospiraceae bacterium]
MIKKYVSIALVVIMCAWLVACGSAPASSGAIGSAGGLAGSTAEESGSAAAGDDKAESGSAGAAGSGDEADSGDESADDGDDFRIGIVTGSYAQSEDDRRGAEAFQEKYGEDSVTLAIYPDNFTEEEETTIQIMVNLAEDPKIKAIIVNQAVDGTTEAFRRIKEIRPDILCIAGEAYEDFADIGETADLVVNSDFVARGYLMIRSAHELGCDTFVHISFPRHLSYETVARQVAIMKAACDEFGMEFAMEEAPDPTTEVGVPGAQQFIADHVAEWVDKYGEKTAFFCTNDAHTEPLIRGLLEHGGYFIEADLPSPLMGYPGALDLDLNSQSGDFEKITETIEDAIVDGGGAGRFGTWTYSYGYTVSAGLAEHARRVILGESELTNINDLAEAYGVFSPGAEWNGSNYTDAATGTRSDNTFLIYQDTYIFGDPGHYMGSTQVEVPEEYFTIQ